MNGQGGYPRLPACFGQNIFYFWGKHIYCVWYSDRRVYPSQKARLDSCVEFPWIKGSLQDSWQFSLQKKIPNQAGTTTGSNLARLLCTVQEAAPAGYPPLILVHISTTSRSSDPWNAKDCFIFGLHKTQLPMGNPAVTLLLKIGYSNNSQFCFHYCITIHSWFATFNLHGRWMYPPQACWHLLLSVLVLEWIFQYHCRKWGSFLSLSFSITNRAVQQCTLALFFDLAILHSANEGLCTSVCCNAMKKYVQPIDSGKWSPLLAWESWPTPKEKCWRVIKSTTPHIGCSSYSKEMWQPGCPPSDISPAGCTPTQQRVDSLCCCTTAASPCFLD